MIIDHNHLAYKDKWRNAGDNQFNGAYFYSMEIRDNIIPRVKTDRNWITVNVEGVGCDHSIVFIHNNLHPENYDWLSVYDDLILVCGIEETMDKVSHLGKAIHLPLSIDVEDVRRYIRPKTERRAFAGRLAKKGGIQLGNVDIIGGMPRDKFLSTLARYEEVYAVGRVALEALVLGCKILPYDSRFPDVDRWKVLDNKDASVILQKRLDEVETASP